MAGPWGKVGTWADDSEAEAAAAAAATPAPLPVEAFPSLGEAAATKSKKKSKGQTLSLSEFATGKYVGPGAKRSGASGIFTDSDKLTSEEMMMLPTGPKDRSDEDPGEHLSGGRLGGGFRDYGGFRGGDRERDREGRGGDRDREREQRGFGFDRERDASRADDSSDWSMNKPSRGGGGGRFDDDRRDRFGGDRDRERFGGDRDAPSKADEVDNWAATKKFVPSADSRRSDDFGRGAGFGKADSDDNWGASKRPVVSEKWSFNNRRPDELGADADKWSRRVEDDSPDRWSRKPNSEEPRRPRLNLQRRTLPVESSAPSGGESTQGSRPSSSHSSRPGTPEAHVDTPPTVESKQRPNPFGNAKPREVLLEERGQDWRKLDLQLDNKRPDSEEEKKLKEEISSLKELAESVGDPAVKEQLAEKEQELEVLSREMDSKARVSVDRWRRGEEPRKPAASAVQENEWRRGGPSDRGAPDAWRRGEQNGRDRPRW